MDYVPHTAAETADMLKAAGASKLEDFFADIPNKFRLNKPMSLPRGRGEQEVATLLSSLAARNHLYPHSLLGAGAYRHFVPAVVDFVISRSEFYTAYTPYQAEISQGMLQAIYEYQTMICRLTGMDVANASMYDGSSAMAEAGVMAASITKREELIVIGSIHPHYRATLATYSAHRFTVREIGYTPSGQVDLVELKAAISDKTAAVLVQSPNFFGVIEDLAAIEPIIHAAGGLHIHVFTEATSLGLLKPPGECGVDIVVGEGQAFGNAVNYGGPYLGVMATTTKYMRKIPGRLSGETTDADGNRGFVLTLQAREQHIRREKATSNICSNQALCALAASTYLVSLGKNLKRLAELNLHKAHYLATELGKLPGVTLPFSGPFYNEFVVTLPDAKAFQAKLKAVNIEPGWFLAKDYPQLPNAVLLCVTELIDKLTLDKVVQLTGGAK